MASSLLGVFHSAAQTWTQTTAAIANGHSLLRLNSGEQQRKTFFLRVSRCAVFVKQDICSTALRLEWSNSISVCGFDWGNSFTGVTRKPQESENMEIWPIWKPNSLWVVEIA